MYDPEDEHLIKRFTAASSNVPRDPTEIFKLSFQVGWHRPDEGREKGCRRLRKPAWQAGLRHSNTANPLAVTALLQVCLEPKKLICDHMKIHVCTQIAQFAANRPAGRG